MLIPSRFGKYYSRLVLQKEADTPAKVLAKIQRSHKCIFMGDLPPAQAIWGFLIILLYYILLRRFTG